MDLFFDNLGIRAKNSVLAHPNVDSWAFYLILLSAMLCRNIPHSELLLNLHFLAACELETFFEFFKMNHTLVNDPNQYFGFWPDIESETIRADTVTSN